MRGAVVLAGIVLLGAAACSDDGGDDPSSAAEATTTTTAAVATAAIDDAVVLSIHAVVDEHAPPCDDAEVGAPAAGPPTSCLALGPAVLDTDDVAEAQL